MKRTPKACNTCRFSKTRCDEQRPICGRCSSLGRTCIYSERPKTSEEERIDELQAEVLALKERLHLANHIAASSPTSSITHHISSAAPPTSYTDHTGSQVFDVRPAKRQKTSFDIRTDTRSSIPDFVTEGIITETQASYYFECFFEGSDRFVPIFDKSDTFSSIRARNGLLFNAICAVGCGASRDITTESRTLHVRLKRWLSTVILSPSMHCLEAVQALLVTACWTPENNIVIAVALKMALDLNLASSFDRLLEPSLRQSSSNEAVQLMKRARTWFDLVVLAKILQVDAGDLLGFSIKNVRRCRSLLNQPYSTALDTRLFSQVELNHLRAKISNDLLKGEESLDDIVTGARLDLSVWYDDWKRIVETSLLSGDETPSLLTNLAIQWHWADAMTACTAFRLCGNNNMEGVTAEQRAFLQMTQSALHLHLDTMLANPEYLDNFKYAMDFVWAKGTYCFLLMLKLSFQLEDSAGQHALLAQGQILHDRLTTVAGQGRSKIYLQLLAFTMNHHMVASHGASPAVDDYVPDEFVFDWDFPVLNLSSSMASQDALLDQFLADDDHLLMETLDTFWAQTGDVGIDSRRSGSRAA